MDDQPHPDLTDQDALQILQALALEFLNREETRNQGERLWRVFSHLEQRETLTQKIEEVNGVGKNGKLAKIPDPAAQQIPDREEVMVDGGRVVFRNCRIETLTIRGV